MRLWTTALWVCVSIGGCDDDSTPGGAGNDVVTAADLSEDTSPADEDASSNDVDAATEVLLGDPDVLVGTFLVQLVEPIGGTPGTTSIIGTVYDGPTPSPVDYHEQAVAGAADADCRLLIPDVPFCEVACTGGDTCVTGGVCAAFPITMDVGEVTVTGLGDAFTMDAIGGTYQPLGPSLPFPAFAAGDLVRVATDGGDYTPFAVESRGIAPLVLTSTEHVVDRDTALTLTWVAPAAANASDAVVGVKLDISHHGGNKGLITCTTADDGELTLSAPLVTALVELGIAGHPTVVLTRTATGSRTIEPGRVDLTVISDVEVGVTIPGLESCFGDADCTDGKTCQDDLTCQ